MGRFEGRVALVTGAAGGIGRAVVERIVGDGGRVVAGDIDRPGLAALVGDFGSAVSAMACDVTAEDGAAALAAHAVEQFGRLDVAVVNAGGGTASLIEDLPLDEWRRVIDLTLTGAFLTVKSAARVMVDGGAIVAVASLSAVQPARGMAAYCAAKAGVVALVDVAALELGARGIRVNAVAPGLVRTPATETLWSIPGMVQGFVENTVIRRYGRPADIAAAVAFLASEEAAYISGTTLMVDGGAHHLRYPDTRRIRASSVDPPAT